MRNRVLSLRTAWIVLALALLAHAGSVGSFRGTIVEAPQASSGDRWIYVQGRNGTARKVEISHARVSYDESLPAAQRQDDPKDALVPGAEVRVSAEQGTDGEWKATRIEILKTVARPGHAASQSAFPPAG